MTRNHKKYKWCTSFNNVQGAWVFYWKDGHEEWKNNQGNKPSGCFPDHATNAVIHWSYLMTTGEESTEEEEKGGYDSQNNDFIPLSHFELLKWLIKIVWYPLLLYIYYFMMLMWPWISLER